MPSDYHRVLLIFLDGVGLAPKSSDNPFDVVATPALDRLAGGRFTIESSGVGGASSLLAIDATLGVDGLPQSATGQTALFSGKNAAHVLGHHATGLPGPTMRSILEQGNLFQWAVERELSTTFANAYSPDYWSQLGAGRRRPSVTTFCLTQAGIKPRGIEELAAGKAVSWDLRRDHFGRYVESVVPLVSAREAGRHLANIASSHRLTVYESFMTDLAGHKKPGFEAREVLARIDGLFAGLDDALPTDVTMIVTSDHGNIEESDHRRHTRNPVPLLVSGPLVSRFEGVVSILDVTPRLLSCLESTGCLGA